MDDLNNKQSFSASKIFNKKVLFILLGVIIVAEIAWASWSLFAPVSFTAPSIQQSLPPKSTSIVLSTESSQVKVGDKFNVSINISTDKKTDGTDLILIYDTSALDVELVGNPAVPIVPGNIYPDYPASSLDTEMGKIAASGISNEDGGTLANGLFGIVTFTAKKAGPTSILVDFTKGSTVDTNVTASEEGGDILESVNKLEVNILP